MRGAMMMLGLVACAGFFTVSASANAQYVRPIQWKVSQGGNGHWYSASTGIANWPAARAICEAEGGALACTETAAEADFLRNAALTTETFVLIGLYQDFAAPDYAEPAGGWRWVSGQPLDTSLWQPGEPNNYFGDERWGVLEGPTRPAYLNDVIPGANAAYYLEWSADCNNDGLVDYGQIRAGRLPDYNSDNVPDCCGSRGGCGLDRYPYEWRVQEGGNGHWYAVLPLPTTNRAAAVNLADSLGGRLVSMGTAAEAAVVLELTQGLGTIERVWIGLSQPPSGTEPLGGWAWDDGTPLDFNNWLQGQPDDSGDEDSAHMATLAAPVPGKWNDVNESGPGGVAYFAAIEWSADCNNDGVVDYGQILRGELPDANGNGVPDTCESVLFVPSQFPTIQAAIDATPAGTARTIAVAAGTYNQAFSLNGKNVVVRGAPGNATIVDGTGLTTSVARFSGGEPATAGIEDLVIRNGTVGSLIFPSASFRVGGGLYAANSSAYVKNCRFESNRSNFGGGAYLYRSSTSIDGCQFVSNIASSEGGGLQLFESSGPIASSSFTGNSAGPAGAGAASAFKVVGARTAGGVVLVSNCTVQSSIGGADTAAVEMFEIAGSGGTEGILRLSNTLISGNSASTGAGGLRVVGTQRSCVLTGGTSICSNSPRNVLGPFLIEGSATVCDCLADLTLDGAVNGADLGAVLAAWGAASANGVGDANHDGFVNGADLAQVLAAWGACQ